MYLAESERIWPIFEWWDPYSAIVSRPHRDYTGTPSSLFCPPLWSPGVGENLSGHVGISASPFPDHMTWRNVLQLQSLFASPSYKPSEFGVLVVCYGLVSSSTHLSLSSSSRVPLLFEHLRSNLYENLWTTCLKRLSALNVSLSLFLYSRIGELIVV